ncbi:hypothetical protein H5410_040451, partial [Solanum commersonii]
NVGKHFVVASRSPGRTPLTTPSKSYVGGVVAFSNFRMLVEDVAFDKRPHFLTLSHAFPGVPERSVTLEFRRHFSSVALSATLKSVA